MKYFFLLFTCLFFLPNLQAQTWEEPYIGADSTVFYLPDANAVYWRYGGTRVANGPIGLQIKGEFPNARYFSYNIYNDDTKMTLGSFKDYEISPDKEDINPFLSLSQNETTTYTLYIVPEGSDVKAKNVLYFPDSLVNVSVLLRYYLPNNDIFGGGNLPEISFYNVDTKNVLKASPSTPIPSLSKEEVEKYILPRYKWLARRYKRNPDKVLAKIRKKQKKGNSTKTQKSITREVTAPAFNFYTSKDSIHSYNFKTEGTYPNNDNFYLTMPIIRSEESDVLLLKFRPPNYPKSENEYNSSDVRYFSISQGDEFTYNYITLHDENLKVNKDGFIYLAIAHAGPKVNSKIEELDINFMPWKTKNKMLIIYRQMLPLKQYKFGIDKVPQYDPNKQFNQYGSIYIQDYSPVGRFISLQDFLLINDL